MESSCNYYIDLLTNLNGAGHIMPYLGYINWTAAMLLSLCKRTNEFWKENVEIISCVVLKDKGFKHTLVFNNNFSPKRAQFLLKYKTYLLYDIDICIGTPKSFKTMLEFLESTENIPNSFFRSVDISLKEDSLNVYNSFILKYIEMGFPTSAIHIKLSNALNDYKSIVNYSDLGELEFIDKAVFPFTKIIPFKAANTGCINVDYIFQKDLDKECKCK